MDKSWASIIGELQSAGMTYAQIGEAIGAAGSTVGDLATGRSQSPRAASAFALLKLHSSRFLQSSSAEGTTIRHLVDSPMSKRALRAKLGMASDKHLATLLQLPAEEVEAWPEEGVLPVLPQIQRLLGVEAQPAAEPANDDPDADRIGPVDTA
ncbi:helix-turn-helix domain-containing protein [Stenotrophomonas maltophilia]|uniref:helix-turn-helix domain-containing protein n=1 Tax=Stenotrophomonas maltophilia TaxID=40324 RepID=UPI0012B002EA|nr:helix-turn-helix domain-containing protein [Stenotrophomonas maltophilia]QGM04899.1 hypothetical protein FEO88_08330 [Stenotrophomonas maltophilia]